MYIDNKTKFGLKVFGFFGSEPSRPSRTSLTTLTGGQKKNQALIWGVTGEQEWSPALTTGDSFVTMLR